MKKLKTLFILVLIISITSCSSGSDGAGNSQLDAGRIQLKIKAINPSARSASTQNTNVAEVIFTDFRISIRDVIFKNDDDPNSSLDSVSVDEIQFRGPFQIDLLNDTDALTQTIGDVVVPDGLYKELRLKFHKDRNLPASDNLFDRSIYIEGTIDGTPFVFWHDTSENLDLGRSTGVRVENGLVNFTIQFSISQFLNSFNQIDLSQATDDNNNGIIEINPNDQDGNQNIAKDLKENIKAAADLLNI